MTVFFFSDKIKPMKEYTVYLGSCDSYNPDAAADVIRSALDHVSLEKPIGGKVVIKPNLVMAHPKVATENYTRKEIAEGILKVVLEKGVDLEKVDVVEKSGLGITTSGAYRNAGYRKMVKNYKKNGKCPVNLRGMEERRRSTVVLEKGNLHSFISIAREIAERDFLIFAPKFKTNVLSHAYSGALKLNIGTIDSKERLQYHHHQLHVKIVDILEAANPDLIVTDGIRLSFGGNQMTQKGTDVGVIAVSTNAVAHDMVCAKLLNLDPFKIEHIKEAMDRGYGPTSFDQIRIVGDFPVEKAQTITRSLDFGFYPVHQFKSNLDIRSGTPYCTGGCHGIFLDWLHMIRDRKPNRLKRFPNITVVIGRVNEPIEAKRLLLVGECAKASPHIKGKKVVRMRGCPPSHKWIVLVMLLRFGLFAPLVLPSLIIDGFGIYPWKKVKGWFANRKKR